MPRRKGLPFGSQFSPTQVKLPDLLEIIKNNEGSQQNIESAIKSKFFLNHAAASQAKLANNTWLSLKDYKIIDESSNVTDFGKNLYNLRNDPEKLYEAFARHILVTIDGLAVIEVIQDMNQSGEQITLESLRKRINERGLYFPAGGTHFSSLKGWLSLSGVFDKDSTSYKIHKDVVERIIGVKQDFIDKISSFDQEQKAYLKALAALGVSDWIPSNDVRSHAEKLYGINFSEKALPIKVLFPLRDTGLIEIEKSTSGRGAKPYLIKPTDKFQSDIILPIIQNIEERGDMPPRRFFQMRLDEILQETKSEDKHIKGKALEALSIYIMRLLDLEFVAWRLRGEVTGGAEVDVIVEGIRLVFNRWQIQCKNTKVLTLDDVAKEVGLAFHLKSNVILALTTGRISSEAIRYANSMMTSTNLNILFLDSKDLDRIIENPSKISSVVYEQSKRVMEIKSLFKE